MISGRTKLVGIFGDPIVESLSPAMHNAAFAAASLDWSYLPFRVRTSNLPAAVAALRVLDIAGVNVTMPHKAAVLPHLDFVDPAAEMITSVNTIVNRDGRLEGYSTDGAGFRKALEDAGVDISGRRVVIAGAGGAARAVAASLAAAKISSLDVVARRSEAINRLRDIIRSIDPSVRFNGYSLNDTGLSEIVSHADIVINATPLGKTALEGLTYLVNGLGPDTTAADLSTVPPLSAFLVAAQERGCTVINGRSMLVHQGSLSFEIWTGQAAPLDVMRRALGLPADGAGEEQ